MTTRRHFLKGGFAALGFGLAAGPPALSPARIASDLLRWRGSSSPVRSLGTWRPSVPVDGLPFDPWFSGDDFSGPDTIPFHNPLPPASAPATEEVQVAIVGGGISGLATAYLLRDKRPVVFELHPRFGGNAQGEEWGQTRYSLGSAYVITPDAGTFLHDLYHELGLHRVQRSSFPPDPMELRGAVEEGYWSGTGMSADEQLAFRRYGEVVSRMANEAYPEIPLPADPEAANEVRDLDRQTFRDNLELQMGLPLTPFLAAGVQSYFYSSFGAGMEYISAAAGWNFVAAEEFGRWVFPGGNSYLAGAMWNGVRAVERRSAVDRAPLLRPNCTVIDVRRAGERYRVTWLDAGGQVHALLARYVVMAGSKHICKYVLHDLAQTDPDKYAAMQQVETMAYVVANVLLDRPVRRDFYDIFLIGDEAFPMTPGAFENASRPVDVIDATYAQPAGVSRSALTLYWPLPWFHARFSLLAGEPWQTYASALTGPTRAVLDLLDIPASAVRQIRMTRWGHAMPLAKPDFIAGGTAEELLRPYDDRVFFVNQDNWALPAVENSLLDAQNVATQVRSALG